MRNDLWPYKQTKNKAYFKDGDKELVMTRKNKYHWHGVGDKIMKTLLWDVGETVHLDRMKFTYGN